MAKPQRFKKFKKDGNVAVLYSPGYGAGWSTWGPERDREAMCMDADLVSALLNGGRKALRAKAKEKYPDAYDGGLDDLKVGWVPEGSRFEIAEYDGSERIRVFGDAEGFLA